MGEFLSEQGQRVNYAKKEMKTDLNSVPINICVEAQ